MRKAFFLVILNAGENTDEELQDRLKFAVDTHFKSRKPSVMQIDDAATEGEYLEDDENNVIRRIDTYCIIGDSEEGNSHP